MNQQPIIESKHESKHESKLDSSTIYVELDKIMTFWFPSTNNKFQEFWFSSEYDSYIKINFHNVWDILIAFNANDLVQLVNNTPIIFDAKMMFLGIVICIDQFTRNINRVNLNNNNVNARDRTIYAKTDDLCFEFVQRMTSNSDEIINKLIFPITSFKICHRIFVLLPYRHQRKTILLDFVMNEIQLMEQELKFIQTNIVNRFKIATIKDYSKVTDTIKHYSNTIDDQSQFKSHLILSKCEISFDDTEQIRNTLNHIIDDNCLKYSLLPITYCDEKIKSTIIYTDTLNFIQKNNIKNVCISLSGGVDSMVLSYILHHLRMNKHINNLCAVHVDYGNRQVSLDEAEIVESWCAYLNIPLITRRVEHIKRHDSTILVDNIDRTLYESETKNIRFNLYRCAMKLYDVTSIMLGHHRDDLTENVLMNVLRGGDILNLFTMKEHQIIDGVPISRPMLHLLKVNIYDVAHKYEVPYLKDTTSEDCFRGTIRKIIMPALEKIDPVIGLKINMIGNSSNQWNQVVTKNIIDPIIASTKKYKFGLTFEFYDSYKSMNFIAWQKILVEIFHRNNVRMISNRNLTTFMNWLSSHNGFIKFSNGHMCRVLKNTVFKNTIFESESSNCDYKDDSINHKQNIKYMVFIKTEIAQCIQKLNINELGQPIPMRYVCELVNELFKPLTIVFNGWTIYVEQEHSAESLHQERKNYFNKRIIMSDLMNGEFSYYYRTCVHGNHSAYDDSPMIANINYSMGCKESDNKRFFKGQILSRYIPCIHFGIQCAKCRKSNNCIVYKITYFYGQ